MSAGPASPVFAVCSEQSGDIVHLRLSGELDMATSPELDGWLSDALHDGHAQIVVDLEGLTFMDASGLRSFLQAADRASRSGRGFAIVNPSDAVHTVLAITRTTHLLGSGPAALPTEYVRAFEVSDG